MCCAPGFLGGGNEAPLGAGCNCIFDNNTVDTVSYECSDTGAFYTCGQQATAWVNRGNVLKNSLFKRIRNTTPFHLGAPSVQAIYLDDQMSGWHISNNTFEDSYVGGTRTPACCSPRRQSSQPPMNMT